MAEKKEEYINVRLSPSMKAALDKAAEAKDVPFSQIVRDALRVALKVELEGGKKKK